jgi:hypothetical protein
MVGMNRAGTGTAFPIAVDHLTMFTRVLAT